MPLSHRTLSAFAVARSSLTPALTARILDALPSANGVGLGKKVSGSLLTNMIGAGASLFDARTMFDDDNPRADEVLRSIVHSLPLAVHTCLEAAAAELDKPRQAALLKVSSTGHPSDRLTMSQANLSAHSETLQRHDVQAGLDAWSLLPWTQANGSKGFRLELHNSF